MTPQKQHHDPQKALSDLRDHLARHDKPIAFYFGAGTSCAVRVTSGSDGGNRPLIPAVAELTSLCRADAEKLGEKFLGAWDSVQAQCVENEQDPNVENVLSRLRMMLGAVGGADTLAGLNKNEIARLEECVRKTIARLVTPGLGEIPTDFPHRKLARWLAKASRQSPVEIFTVNYDVLIEHGLEAERIPTFDGFVGSYQPFFHADSLRRPEAAPGANWVRLWKMHGSVTWRRVLHEGRVRIVRSAPDPSGEMIFPSYQKYDESRQQPYSAFADRLSRFLRQDDALLVVAGFSFGDEHMNDLMFEALEGSPRTHVFALQYDELPEGSDVVKRAYQRPNMIIIGPKTGIVGGRRLEWTPAESPPFMQGVFELREAPTAEVVEANGGEVEKFGHMRIGDFAVFCEFLQSMGPG